VQPQADGPSSGKSTTQPKGHDLVRLDAADPVSGDVAAVVVQPADQQLNQQRSCMFHRSEPSTSTVGRGDLGQVPGLVWRSGVGLVALLAFLDGLVEVLVGQHPLVMSAVSVPGWKRSCSM
jgi:hypothetical protein